MPRKLSPLEKAEKASEAQAWGRRHNAPAPSRFYIEDGKAKPYPITEEEIRIYDAENGVKYRKKGTIQKLINHFQPPPFMRILEPVSAPEVKENGIRVDANCEKSVVTIKKDVKTVEKSKTEADVSAKSERKDNSKSSMEKKRKEPDTV
ncbi:hypothetical protein MP638_006671 [Amoeboaphelidium occidentale]|nr:hypothetical protein MP638_006671 [Amoeboaphelidium occidentale]